ncbi:MAG TPA: tetratricopeptide repeat protein [Gemmatimonadaceae bacterium]
MSNTAKLKKKAADYEAKRQYEKALEVYEQVLNTKRGADEERDVALYNRVGDLHYRLGNNEQAIHYYEQAADYYAEGGFFNNAIALCNKILRYAPGRTIVYYKLGIISAKKGFNSDAKQNFLEYADRMQRAGKMDEAFNALKEFADLCPGQDDVRLMLADQLARADRKPEALEQLELLYDVLQGEGRDAEANAALERMKALDPAFKPRKSITPLNRNNKQGLVFLDLDFNTNEHQAAQEEPGKPAAKKTPARKTPARKTPIRNTPVRNTPARPSTPAAEAKPVEIPEEFIEVPRAPALEGLELTSLSDEPAEQHDALPIDSSMPAEPEIAATEPVAPEPVDEQDFISHPPHDLVFLTPPEEEPVAVPDIAPLDLAPLTGEPALIDAEPVDFTSPDPDPMWNGSSDEEFIDLGEWLEKNRTPSSTRMIAHDEEPEDNEQKDFAEMLDKFKDGISRNVDEEDFESHYDLGIAFREMGLLDEAIGSFQKAARGPDQVVRASEAIGQCFMDKGEAGVTVTVLERLLRSSSLPDSQLVGVLYLLGRAAESLSREAEAAAYYQRVLAVQIGFRDAATRLSSLTPVSR